MALIAVEGIDGAGCGTQAERLQQFLENEHGGAELYTYPDYQHPTGELLQHFLDGRFDLSTEEQFLLYLSNMIGDQDTIGKTLARGNHVVADRYVTSTLAYQEVNGMDRQTMLNVINELGLVQPDLVIHLDCPVTEAHSRKQEEKEEMDRYEEDMENQRQVARTYKDLASENVYSREWTTIDASPPVDRVQQDIQDAVEKEIDL
ncbi:MAG: dTMP kinase [Candidatus Nanohaloarchaea archaeon]|nr:dTMP kinase [Candidatus Nanohaloarchaea archaeon]